MAERPELELLYKTYRTELYRYLCALCHNADRAEDLLSDTFLRAIQCAGGWHGGPVKAWLFGLARNVWREDLRRRHETLPYDDLLGITLDDRLAESTAARQALARVQALLDEKGPPAERVVRLRAAGYSYAEIAAKLNISESSARVLEHRTRRWLQTTLQKEGLLNET